MSGGPQVFLGATTFFLVRHLISGRCEAPLGRGCLWPHGCSGRRRARPPARLGGLTSFGAAPRSPPVPSGPSGALRTSGARCADVAWHVVSKPARPRRRPRTSKSGPASVPQASHAALVHIAAELPNFACNSPATLSNHEFTTLELQRFQASLKLHPIELRASFLVSGHMAAGGCHRSFA